MKREIVSTLLPEEISKERLQKKAAEYGLPYTVLMQRAIQIVVEWDPLFYELVKGYADALHITLGAAIEGMILRTFAEREARKEVWGSSGGEILPEFSIMGNKPMTGKELFGFLKDWFIQKEEQERVNLLLREEDEGIPLSDDDKAFLIKKRKGQTWLESKECAQEQQEKKEAEAQLTPKQREAMRHSLEVTREVNRILREEGEEAAHEYLRKIKAKGQS